MELKNVVSSNLAQVGYEPNQNVLIVRFKNGAYYRYDSVPEQVYNNFITAQSIGKYFQSYIRNTYSFKKLDVTEGVEIVL